MGRFRGILSGIVLASVSAAVAADPSAAGDDNRAGAARGSLAAGLEAGQLYENFYLAAIYKPWGLKMEPTQIIDGEATYRVYQFSHLPLQVELEGGIAKRWGEAHEYELFAAPYLRWQSFPWNDQIYTNLRVSQLGLSYASGISRWERENSGNQRGSRFLQCAGAELTFARSPSARFEVLLGLHHRSGIYGLINGVSGGSNFVIVGFRAFD